MFRDRFKGQKRGLVVQVRNLGGRVPLRDNNLRYAGQNRLRVLDVDLSGLTMWLSNHGSFPDRTALNHLSTDGMHISLR